MSYTRAVALNGVANALDRGINTMWRFVDREDRLKREAKYDELRSVYLEAAKTGLEKTRKDMRDKERAAKLQAAMASGDFDGLDPDDAAEVDRYIQQVAPEAAERVAAAKLTLPVVRGAKQRFEQYRQQVQQAGGSTPQGAQEYFSMASDPGFGEFAPALGKALFAKGRFDRSYKKTVGGKEYEYTIDKNNPIADMNVHLPTGKVVAHLRAVDKDGNDITSIVRPVATEQQGTGDDELVVTRTPEELEQYVSRVAADGERILKLRNTMAQKKLIEVSPELQKGLTEQIVKKQQFDTPELQPYKEHPVYGAILQQAQAFGGTPDRALEHIRRIEADAKKLADSKKEGLAMAQVYLTGVQSDKQAAVALLNSSGLSKDGMETVLKLWEKRDTEKARLEGRQEDRALRRELAAGRGGKGGGNGSSTAADRNEIMRIESERKAHEQAVKAAAADVKKYQYEYQDASDSPEKKAAQEKYNAALQRRDAFMARAYPATETQQPTPYKDNVTMQGLTGGGAANNYGYGPRQGVNAPVFSAMPPAGKLTGRTITDTATGKRYTSNGKSWIEVR